MTTAKQGDIFLCFLLVRIVKHLAFRQGTYGIEPEIIRLGGPQHIVASSI